MPSLYFISGTMCTQELWQFIFPALQNYTPVHIDITAANSFHEINTIIDSKITSPAIIIGFSLGGFAALHFASQHPNKVKKLIVIAANANGLSNQEIALRHSTIQFLEKHSYKGISTNRIQQFLHPSNHQNKTLVNIIKKMDADLGKDVLIQQLKATSKRIDITQFLKLINTPIVLIAAKEDQLVQHQDIVTLHQQLKNSSIATLKNCGHMIPLEQPTALATIILAQL